MTSPASPQPGNQDERDPDEWCFDCDQKHSKCECYPYDADLADRQTGAGEEADEVSAIRPGCGTTPLLAEFRRRHPILTEDDEPAPSAGQDTGQMRDEIAQTIADWMAAPYDPDTWQFDNASDVTGELLDGASWWSGLGARVRLGRRRVHEGGNPRLSE